MLLAGAATPSLAAIGALAIVAFVAGVVDAIAGGGGLLTLPSIMAAGLPTHIALGTNKGCSTFGTAAATATFARARKLDGPGSVWGFLGGAAGAIAGAHLQLAFSPAALRPLILILLVCVAAYLVAQRPAPTRAPAHVRAGRATRLALSLGLALLLGVYDGFFGPGTGTFLIMGHVSLLGSALATAAANAKAVNLGSNAAALATFAWRGTVLWQVAIPMAMGNVLGGVVGARLAMHGGDRLVRVAVIAVSLAIVAKLAFDLIRA